MSEANKENSIIDKILGQMKSTFNQATQSTQECKSDSPKENHVGGVVDEIKTSDNVHDNVKSLEFPDNIIEGSIESTIIEQTPSKQYDSIEVSDPSNRTPIKHNKRRRKNTEEFSTPVLRKTIEEQPGNSKTLPYEAKDQKHSNNSTNTEKILSKNSSKNEKGVNSKDSKAKTNKKTDSESEKSEKKQPAEGDNLTDDKPRIVLTFRQEKSNMKIISEKTPQSSPMKDEASDTIGEKEADKQLKSPGRRSLRIKSSIGDLKLKTDALVDCLNVKRSPRRRSKDYSESVLANAIARKEKSYEPVVHHQRLSRRIKPTAKILANKNLRMGVELQNSARLSISNDKDREKNDEKLLLERSIIQKTKKNSEGSPIDIILSPVKDIKDDHETSVKENFMSDEKLTQENHLKILGLCSVEKPENKLREETESKEFSGENIKCNRGDDIIKTSLRSRQRQKSAQGSKRNLRDRSKKSLDEQINLPNKIKRFQSSIQEVSLNIRKRLSFESERNMSQGKKRIKSLDNNDVVILDGICVDDSKRRSSEPKDRHHFIETEKSVENIKDDSPCSVLEAEQSNIGADIPEISANLIATKPISCLCTHKTNVYAERKESLFCKAVDSIDNRPVGCLNNLNSLSEKRNDFHGMLLRVSVKVPYMIMCASHRERLYKHLCCAGCGVFCTHGTFRQCINKHLYHTKCSQIIKLNACCPHCGSDNSKDVDITMHTKNKIVFMPVQGDYSQCARMNFKNCQTDNSKKVLIDLTDSRPETPPLLDKSIITMLKNIKSIPTEHSYTYKDLVKFLKIANTEKLVHVIASGLDLNQPLDESVLTTALHMAARSGLLDVVHILVVCGAQIDILDREQRTPIMLAVMAGKNEVVQYLIKAGSDIKFKGTDGMSALHLAAKTGNLEACQLLLSMRNIEYNYINGLDDGGWTPLVWAAEHARFEIVKYLLEQNADPHIPDAEQNVVVHWAALSGSSSITEMLLNHKCDVNSINAHGDTPLHIGARQNNYRCVLILLARNARVDLRNNSGESALDCCTEGNDSYNAISLNVQLQGAVNQQNFKILTNDISRGKEMNPIQCINAVDYEPYPRDFTYITRVCVTSDIKVSNKIASLQFCECEDKCSTKDCHCGSISLSCWYDDDGKLIENFNYEDPPLIFECNDACNCNKITCLNRVVQRGITSRLEVVRTTGKGWTVRSLRYIPRGTFIAEYIGELLTDADADQRVDDSYLFALDGLEEDSYCIDAREYGNITRFINHSCDANLVPVRVFVEHQDLRFPRIAFFASKDIQAQDELGFDYGEKFWIIKHDKFNCLCRSANCKYSIDTISETLKIYN